MERITNVGSIEDDYVAIVSPPIVRRDSRRSWGPYAESAPNVEISDEVQERLALKVIEYLKTSQQGFEQRMITQTLAEQNKRERENQMIVEQLQSLHVEQGRVNWDHESVKEKIEQTMLVLAQQQQWLVQQVRVMSERLDWQQSSVDIPMGETIPECVKTSETQTADPTTATVDGRDGKGVSFSDTRLEREGSTIPGIAPTSTLFMDSTNPVNSNLFMDSTNPVNPNLFMDATNPANLNLFMDSTTPANVNVLDGSAWQNPSSNTGAPGYQIPRNVRERDCMRCENKSPINLMNEAMFWDDRSFNPYRPAEQHSREKGNEGPSYPMSESVPYQRVAPHASWQLHKIANATKFDAKNLDGWVREIRYWRELYHHLDDDQMLASLGLNNTEEIKSLMMDFLDETKLRKDQRSVEHFLAKVIAEYGSVSDIVRMERLQQFMTFVRKKDWDIRKFWRKCRETRLYLKQAGVDLDDRVVFTQILTALQLTNQQRSMVLSVFEASRLEKTVLNLQNVTVKVFGNYGSQSQETFLTGNGDYDEEEETDTSCDEALLVKRNIKKKTKPGMDTMAVRRTTANTGLQNGKGHGNTYEAEHILESDRGAASSSNNTVRTKSNAPLCLRCQSPDHFWRQCPMPFRKDLNFGQGGQNVTPKVKNVPKNREDLRRTLLTMAEDILLETESIEGTLAPENDDMPRNGETNDTAGEEKIHLCWVSTVFRVDVLRGSNVSTNVVIDSGASSTVCSVDFLKYLPKRTWDERLDSSKKFRFGDSRCFPSLGSIVIRGFLDLETKAGFKRTPICVKCDVVEASIPVLISRLTLVRMSATIRFDTNTLIIGSSGTVKLSVSKSGHLILPLCVDSGKDTLFDHGLVECYPVQTKPVMDLIDLVKIHKQLGHVHERQLAHVLRQAGYDVNPVELKKLIDKCGCRDSRVRSYSSIANAHLAPYPGYAVFVDIVYLRKTGHKDPYVMMIDSFSRFLVCVPTPSIKPRDIIRIFEIFWMHWLGRPRFLIRDSGPGLVGNDWNDYARIHDISLICNPTDTPSQMGALERHVGLLKTAIDCLQGHDRKMEFEEVVRAACLARNNSMLLGCGKTPAQICFGKNDYFNAIENGGVQSLEDLNSEEARWQRHVLGVMEARNCIMKVDAETTIKNCLKYNLRPGYEKIPEVGSSVDVVQNKCWVPGWRMTGMIGSNAVVEQDNRFKKIPLTRVRPSEDKTWLPSKRKDASSSSTDVFENRCDLGNIAHLEECWWVNPREDAVEKCVHGISAVLPMINQRTTPFSAHGLFSGYSESGLEQIFENKAVSKTSEEIPEEDFDPSRLPPKFYLSNALCIEAIILEMNGLLQKDSSGRSALEVVDRFDEKYRNWTIIRSTLVVRWKGPLRAKARLCIRGDLMPIRDQVSAPTPFRSSMKIFVAMCSACNFELVSMDISQAFIQAAELNIKDQILVLAPDCIQLPWAGVVVSNGSKKPQMSRYVLKVIRPLYGLRESPLRWFIQISTTIRRFGFRQLRSDICLFSRRKNGKICSLMLLYVDDILFGYQDESELSNFKSMLSEYRTGDMEYLTTNSELSFLGLDLKKLPGGDICISQRSFIERIKFADSNELIKDKSVIASTETIRTFFRKILGSLIWVLQTRFDIGYLVTMLATSSPYVGKDPKLILEMIRLTNRIIKTLKNTVVEIRYGPFFSRSTEVTESLLCTLRLFCFTDAGYASLRDRKSIETAIFIFGKEVSRDGSIQCVGSPIDFYSRKIGRCVRSTIAAEAVSAANGIEVVLWHHSVIFEMISGETVDGRPNTEDTFPLCTPFAQAETISLCSTECVYGANLERFEQSGETVLTCKYHGSDIYGGTVFQALSDLDQLKDETKRENMCPKAYCTIEGTKTLVKENNGEKKILFHEDSRRLVGESGLSLSPKLREEILIEEERRSLESKVEAKDVLLRPVVCHPEMRSAFKESALKIIGLCDSANVFSAVSNWQPRSQDKLTQISLSFIRDYIQIINFSFLDAYHNIADAGSKIGGNVFCFTDWPTRENS